MAHNARTQPDATWTTGSYVTLASDWQSLDTKLFKAINGDQGGTWTPSSPLVLTGSAGGQLTVTGPTIVDWGGSLATSSSSRFSLSNTTWPKLSTGHVGRTRTIVTSCLRRQANPKYAVMPIRKYHGIQAIACTVQAPNGVLEQTSFYVPLRVHDGSTIASATLTFRVPTPRKVGPVAMPRLRIIRADPSGLLLPLMSMAAGADVDGYISAPFTTSPTVWYNGGAVQSLTYACDQSNVVDVSQYQYFAQGIDEIGTLAAVGGGGIDGTVVRERKKDLFRADGTSPVFLVSSTVSGLAGTTAGDRVLCTANTNRALNGIWITASGGWSRPSDLYSQADFSPGLLVRDNITGILWECTGPVAGQSGVTVTPGTANDSAYTPVTFGRRVPRGNIYHAVSVSMTGIADMRFQ